jgi:hypothetical protein
MLVRKLGTGCQLKYSDELFISDCKDLLQHRIEEMADGLIPTSILTPNQGPNMIYRAILQKGKTAKIIAGSHEVMPKTGGNTTSEGNARMILSMQPSYDRSRRPA